MCMLRCYLSEADSHTMSEKQNKNCKHDYNTQFADCSNAHLSKLYIVIYVKENI